MVNIDDLYYYKLSVPFTKEMLEELQNFFPEDKFNHEVYDAISYAHSEFPMEESLPIVSKALAPLNLNIDDWGALSFPAKVPNVAHTDGGSYKFKLIAPMYNNGGCVTNFYKMNKDALAMETSFDPEASPATKSDEFARREEPLRLYWYEDKEGNPSLELYGSYILDGVYLINNMQIHGLQYEENLFNCRFFITLKDEDTEVNRLVSNH